MFLRFTKKFSRPKLGFIIALLMLFAPAFIVTTVTSAQRNKAKTAPTPKKKATPVPNKKTQAKTKPTPLTKSKTNAKNSAQNTSKNKTADKRDKRNEKNDRNSKNNQKTTDRNKNSKNSKQTLAANTRIPSKNDRNSRNNERDSRTRDRNSKNNDRNSRNNDRYSKKDDRYSKNSERNKNSSTRRNREEIAEREKPATSRNTKRTVAKTTPKTRVDKRSKDDNITIIADKTVEKAPETTTTELPQIIVTSFSVPVRSQAKPDSPALSNIKLGTVLKVTEKNPAWYKVQYSAGGQNSTGWISANSVNDLNAAGKTEIYHQIVERNYKPQMDFQSASEFYEFLTNVDGELDSSDKSAEIELKRLLALRSALKTIPADKRETEPYRDFLKAQEKEIVYNEPAGQWIVVSNQFWDLHNKYKKYGVSDTIAWEAANNPLPGECEGYVNCYLFDMRMRFGEYLNLHPNGKNAAEALRNMTDYLSPIAADSSQKKVYNGPSDVTDRAEFNNLIAELRTIVARLQFIEKEKTLQQLRQIAEGYR